MAEILVSSTRMTILKKQHEDDNIILKNDIIILKNDVSQKLHPKQKKTALTGGFFLFETNAGFTERLSI